MHTITGVLRGISVHNDHGLANLQYELEQTSPYTHHPVLGVCCVGRTQAAHAAAQRIMEQALYGAEYPLTGAALAAVDGRVWLMGVTSAMRKPSLRLAHPPTTVREAMGAIHA